MSQLTDKIKEKVESVSKQLERIDAAGRGLILRVSQEGGRQIEELAKEGETQLESGNGFVAQMKEIVKIEGSAKDLVSKVKWASLGLVEKAKQESQKTMDDLTQEVEKKVKPKTVKAKTTKKTTKTAKVAQIAGFNRCFIYTLMPKKTTTVVGGFFVSDLLSALLKDAAALEVGFAF